MTTLKSHLPEVEEASESAAWAEGGSFFTGAIKARESLQCFEFSVSRKTEHMITLTQLRVATSAVLGQICHLWTCSSERCMS